MLYFLVVCLTVFPLKLLPRAFHKGFVERNVAEHKMCVSDYSCSLSFNYRRYLTYTCFLSFSLKGYAEVYEQLTGNGLHQRPEEEGERCPLSNEKEVEDEESEESEKDEEIDRLMEPNDW